METPMPYKPFDTFFLRIPKYPFDYLVHLLEEENIFDKEIQSIQIQEAIYIASPILYKELCRLINNEINNVKEKKHIINSISRYLSRMSTRCTPFGLFASCSLGSIDIIGDGKENLNILYKLIMNI
jgi:hypothetical protein